MLAGILLDARQANTRDGITGALICRRDIYLQMLEGPAPAVKAAYGRIRRDDRHVEVRLHVSDPVEERLFADWAMMHDPAAIAGLRPTEEIADDLLDRVQPGRWCARCSNATRGRRSDRPELHPFRP